MILKVSSRDRPKMEHSSRGAIRLESFTVNELQFGMFQAGSVCETNA